MGLISGLLKGIAIDRVVRTASNRRWGSTQRPVARGRRPSAGGGLFRALLGGSRRRRAW
jgi:hypothetical protein